MRWLLRAGLLVGIALLAAAIVVSLWPLHANGVSGASLWPRYDRDVTYSIVTFEPVPRHPTADELRRFGVRLPEDVVGHRRHIASAMLGAGDLVLLAVATGVLRVRRVRRSA